MSDPLHDLYLRAVHDGWRQTNIAEQSGVNIASLRQFKSDVILGPENRKKLRSWLRRKGYDATGTSSPFDLAIARTRGLLATLESKVSDTAKVSAMRFDAEFLLSLAMRLENKE